METIISGVIGVLIGALLGHMLALGRDKRKEYNLAIRPLKQKILKHVDSLKEGKTNQYISDDDISEIRCWLPEKLYGLIKLAHKNYCSLFQKYEINDVGMQYWSTDVLNEMAKLALDINCNLPLK
jgi:hypothetical protein